jgi:hypothetical protein
MTCRSNRALRGVGIAAAIAAAFPVSGAHAFSLGVQDQGASNDALEAVYGALGAQSVRLIVRPGDPQTDRVRFYRSIGAQVQASILLKRSTTPGDVRGLMRAWDGQVRTVSIGNEPELNGLAPCQYARVYRRSSALVRREFPGTRIGIGEQSPGDPIGYMRRVMACPGPRLRASFYAIHPYCFRADPLAPCVYERRAGNGTPGWIGLGDLRRMRRFLNVHGMRRLPIRCTEFSYLTSGGYATTPAKAAWMWPRAVKQARRWCAQLVIYGFGPVHQTIGWGDASLLDRFGRRTPAFLALARALGRTLRPEPALPTPSNALPGLPDAPPLSHGEGEAKHDTPPAQLEPSVDPAPSSEEPKAEPPIDTPAPADPVPVETPAESPVEAP